MSIYTITRDYLSARETLATAEAAKVRAEAALKEALAAAGMETITVDGRKVTVTRKERMSINAELLAAKVSKAWFRKLTAPSVKLPAFRAALELGELPGSLVEEVATMTSYDEVRVTAVR
jgi:hypothetical protein